MRLCGYGVFLIAKKKCKRFVRMLKWTKWMKVAYEEIFPGEDPQKKILRSSLSLKD